MTRTKAKIKITSAHLGCISSFIYPQLTKVVSKPDYERLETLGDGFLNFSCGLYVFLMKEPLLEREGKNKLRPAPPLYYIIKVVLWMKIYAEWILDDGFKVIFKDG